MLHTNNASTVGQPLNNEILWTADDVSFDKPFSRWTFAGEAEILDQRRRVKASRGALRALDSLRWEWRGEVIRRVRAAGKQEMDQGAADWAPIVDLNGKPVLGEWRLERTISAAWQAVQDAIDAAWASEGFEWEELASRRSILGTMALATDSNVDADTDERLKSDDSDESSFSDSDESDDQMQEVNPGQGQALVLYDWTAQDSSQLSVAAGDILELVSTGSSAENLNGNAATQEQELIKAFAAIDVDGSGSIDQQEFGELCRRMDPHMDQRAVQRVMSAIDTDGSGEISLDEFRAWWTAGDCSLLPSLRAYWLRVRTLAGGPKPLSGWAKRGLVPRDYVQTYDQYARSYHGLAEAFGLKGDAPISDAEIQEMFDVIDEDGSGLLDRNEVHKMLKGLGRCLSTSDLDAAMEAMDGDGSGEVDADEFREWWREIERTEAAERQRRIDAAAVRKAAKAKQDALASRLFAVGGPKRGRQAAARRGRTGRSSRSGRVTSGSKQLGTEAAKSSSSGGKSQLRQKRIQLRPRKDQHKKVHDIESATALPRANNSHETDLEEFLMKKQ
eukprot:SAG31_NODE_3075_length_4712_cov_2.262302_5_plen_559_part_01